MVAAFVLCVLPPAFPTRFHLPIFPTLPQAFSRSTRSSFCIRLAPPTRRTTACLCLRQKVHGRTCRALPQLHDRQEQEAAAAPTYLLQSLDRYATQRQLSHACVVGLPWRDEEGPNPGTRRAHRTHDAAEVHSSPAASSLAATLPAATATARPSLRT